MLSVEGVRNLKVNADLVVLSACETALGKQQRGEGTISLTRSFLLAGAAQVVATLWRVDDEASAALLKYFYRQMWDAGLPPAAAMRQAQLAIRREPRWRSPFYWAGFVVAGEAGWRL
jgi:CHAT domain-containing protein